MDIFNKMMDSLKNKEAGIMQPDSETIDTDTDTGTFGSVDSQDKSEAPQGDKLVMYLDSGVEIHIPTAIYDELAKAMNGEESAPVEVGMMMGGEGNPKEGKGMGKGLGLGGGEGPLCSDEDTTMDTSSDATTNSDSESDDDNSKDCPFAKKDEDTDSDEDTEEDDKKDEE